ncbi:hypothetical protein KIL84_020593 [Mauremys mutica]|uniref:Uncharacterized protein n=1 Tax=Mauremys mutica TaxID=74926 RepID=A0A9D4BCF2_9SAUR|nr:hypothetical protein KIL84_020593 [Mauremys mutica]
MFLENCKLFILDNTGAFLCLNNTNAYEVNHLALRFNTFYYFYQEKKKPFSCPQDEQKHSSVYMSPEIPSQILVPSQHFPIFKMFSLPCCCERLTQAIGENDCLHSRRVKRIIHKVVSKHKTK